MPNSFLPLSAAVISSILLFVYCAKEKLKIKENNIYFVMLLSVLLDSMLTFVIFLTSGEGESHILIRLLNRFDFMALIAWSSCLCIYTHMVIHKKDTRHRKRYFITRILLNSSTALECLLVWILRLDCVIENDIIQSVMGPSVYFTFVCCAVNLLESFVIIILNFRKINLQILPVFIGMAIGAGCAVTYYLFPSISGVSMGLTVVNLTMYFTIENPDVQMLKKVNLAKDQAQRASQLKTDFLSDMSHEIRTPINAIVGLARCILNDTSLSAAKEDAADIMNASENLLEIVNGILDISKIESGKMEIINKEYDLTDMASNLAKLIKARIGEKPIELRLSFSDNIPGVLYGDATKVRQIMTNLLTNAVKYTDRGYIDFSIDCVNSGKNANLTIKVRDTGHGIKEEVIGSLFDKFKRLEEDKNSQIEGTGLGLAITRNFAEMLNGKIDVNSVYGEGSTFSFSFSQEIRSVERVIKKEKTITKKNYSGQRLLVVDDIPLNLMVAKRLLETYGVSVDTASSGLECLEKCSENSYEIILLDDMMPHMSGSETLKELLARPNFNVPVIACTANAIDGMRENYIADGFTDYISKPINLEELEKILEKYMKTT